MTIFVFASDTVTSIEEATFMEAIREAEWLYDTKDNHIVCAENREAIEDLIQEHGMQNIVPVGSVEFINGFCKEHGLPELTAMNIPYDLENPRFLHRDIWRNVSQEQLATLIKPGKEYLIKPGLHPKRFDMQKITSLSDVQMNPAYADEPLFVSEYLDLEWKSEWRLFIQNGEIKDTRPYYLKRWVTPDFALCNEMAFRLKKYSAITLDVAVIGGENTTIAVEAHPFMACGLYGFEGPQVLKMARAAWKYHIEH